MTPVEIAIVARLTVWFCRPGGAYADDDPDLHGPRLRFEWRTGQWCWELAPGGDVAGWASWYRVDDETLGGLRRGEQDDWIRARYYPDICHGRHCYVATVIVAPGAPRHLYRALIDRVGALNADAASLAAHVVKRDGRERFAQRINDGSSFWWRRAQGGWQPEYREATRH